ncbi:hypothetical protein [Phytopseudomonas dryadis]|uniref:Lipoprotein n=1 Tax=Phytopseudomonas dryadis TaxID=2487520 RepID=A0ABY1ZC17_9GAMM|nr:MULTISPECIES: hypothetical protein [Pseudomonas]TBV09886.1 hypothetical protein DNK34_00145 [Pseudomonas dryadis]TBV12849.1 hypothetical protein DNK41_23705 [Pseudomonas sp. FRB 230]
MKNGFYLTSLTLLLVLAGCATKVPFTGESHADGTLKSDISQHLIMQAKLYAKCNQVESIQTQVLKINPVGTGPSIASQQYGSVEERWLVQLCDRQIPFLVTLTPDGAGGTFFGLSREQ